MKTFRRLTQTVCLVVLSMLPIGVLAQNMVLVSGTDFSSSTMSPDALFSGVDEVDGFLGVIKPSLLTDLRLSESTKSTKTKSDFLSKSNYAVTPNPIRLDSMRLIDNPEWALVFSNTSSQTPLLFMSVPGLKDRSPYCVEIEWCVPFTDDYLDKANKQVQPYTSTYDVGISAVVNPDTKQDQFSGDGQSFSRNSDSEGDCKVLKISNTSTKCGNIRGGVLNLYINAAKGGLGQAIMIKSIKIYGEMAPTIYSSEGTEFCSGERVTLVLKGEYMGAQYQWYKDGNKINGATSSSYVYEAPQTSGSEEFRVDVTVDGKTIESNTLTIRSERCCLYNRVSAPRKIIFKEDFGEFDLSDKTGKTYKVWDYSDILNPVQVTKTTTTPFRYELDYPPLGCNFEGGSGKEVLDGYYTVAGVLTGYDDVQGMSGAMMGRTNRIGGKVVPTDLEYDHSGKLEGCALFVNCNPNTISQNIYERKIDHLCQNRPLFFECYFSVFTNSAAGSYNPVDITVRLSEVDNPTNVVEMQGRATREVDGGTGTWVKLTSVVFLERSDAVFLEIVNNSNVSEDGNDLVLDDIIIKTCATPPLSAYYDINTLAIDTFTCFNEDDEIEVYADPSDMLVEYFGGEANARFLYQWSLTPEVKTSWKSIGDPTKDKKSKVGATPFAGVKKGDVVYFRVIAGSEYTLTTTDESAYNADDPCADYSVSDAIPCVIDCHTCTESKKPVIGSMGSGVLKNKVLELCRDDKTTLSTNDVTVIDENIKAPYTFYMVTWTKDGEKVGEVAKFEKGATEPVTAIPLDISWSDATETGTQYVVTVHDRFEDGKGTDQCDRSDTITVIALPTPVGRDIVLPPFCENDPSRATILNDTMSKFSSYDITWYLDDQMTIAIFEPDVAFAAPADDPYVYYYTLTNSKGCVSDVYSFSFSVKVVPSEILSEIPTFCEYVNGARSKSEDATEASVLPVSTKGYTVDWYSDLTAETAAETDLSSLRGSTTKYVYYYTLSKDGCTSSPTAYGFSVIPLATLSLEAANVCDKITLRANPTPTDATVTWNTGETGLSLEFLEPSGAGLYSAVATATGYCPSEPAEVEAEFYASPDDLVVTPLSLLKIKAPYETTELLAAVTESSKDPNATIMWMGQFNTQGEPTDKNGSATPNVPDPLYDETTDERCYYYVYQEIKYGTLTCASGFSEILVDILGAPAPKTTNVIYCLNATPASLSDLVQKGGAESGKNYELLWYLSEDQASPESAVPTISTGSVGETTYYVSQREVGTVNESSKVPLTVTVYDAPKPVVTPVVNYCKDETPVALSADYTIGLSAYTLADGYLWYDENSIASETPITPNTASVGAQSYKVSTTYTLPDGSATCESEKSDITVNVYKTTAPSPQTVQYVKADAADDGQTFPAITEAKKPWVEEASYTYYYSLVTESANVEEASGYTTTVPVPVYNTASLGGGTKKLYYYVYRVDDRNPLGCPSDTVKITVEIGDALSPGVKDVYVCEGSKVPDLEASVSILEGSGKSVDDYDLLWYGTVDPTSTTDPTPLNTSSQSTFSTGISSATAVGHAKTTTSYYVTQKDKSTGAESAPSVIHVIVLPKPVVVPKSVPVQCGGTIDLDNWFEVSNASEVGTTSASYKEGSNIVESMGTYPFTVAYPVKYARPDYVVDDAQCVSDESSISVVIDKLDSVWIEGGTTVCPGGDLELVAHIASTTHTENQASFQWEDNRGGTASGMSWTNSYPMTYASESDKVYTYTVTVTAGTCEKTSEVHAVNVGEGSVRGTMTLAESDNAWNPSSFQNDVEREYYSCGGELTIRVDYENTDDVFSYQWYEAGTTTLLAEGSSLTIPATDASSVKTYEVRFINNCDAKAKVVVHTIPLTVVPEISKDTLCEGESFSANLTITCDENPTIQWLLNAQPILGANSSTYSKRDVLESSDEGQYSYEVTNRGCVRKGDSKYLDVQRYIKVADFMEPFIVKKNEDQTIQLEIEVPEPALGVTLSDIDWKENGVSKQLGSSSNYTEPSVVSDHTYELTLDDKDYCPTTTTATIWVEADLQLKTSLKDSLCLGASAVLTIDTTGTGAFRKEDKGIHPTLTVLRYTKGTTEYLPDSLFKKKGDLIEVEVSPEDSASYTVEFTYDDQLAGPLVEEVTILQMGSLTLPSVSTICEGDTIKLGVSTLSHDGIAVSWSPTETILSGADTDTIVAVPTYTGGLNHQGTYTYVVTAYNKACDESKTYNVPVKVDEALAGTLTGSEVICEGDQGEIDASSYGATTYEWKVEDELVSSSATAMVRPTETTTYKVEMTRGTCKASHSYELKVATLPVITSVDSVGVRARSIETEIGKGTGTFYYWVDEESSMATDNTVHNLMFGKHVAYVRDENGCKASMPFTMAVPKPEIPEWFSPNGDGINDSWVIANLADTYPNSTICIYDRSGKLLVKLKGSDTEGWDGTYEGKPMPSTDYWYVVDIEGIDKQYVGHFTLIRY